MPEETDNENQPVELSVEEQLAQYASDLRELFAVRRGLEKQTKETKQMVDLRVHEVDSLNKFMQRLLSQKFEMEAEYESLLNEMDKLYQETSPGELPEKIKTCVENGRRSLERIRSEDVL